MRPFALSVLTAGLVALASTAAQANDTVRLVDFDRGTDGGTDTQLTQWRGGGFGRGGGWGGGGWGRGSGFTFASPRFAFSYGSGRPYWGGGWGGGGWGGGWNRSYWGGGWNRSFWGGGWGGYYGRPYWGGGWGGYYGRPFYGASYYYPRYYAPVYYSYPVYYSSYPVYYSYPSYYYSSVSYPVVDEVTVVSSATTSTLPAPRTSYSQPLLQSVPQTYPYDGGPAAAPPMPGTDQAPNPTSGPRPTVPLEGRLVSLPRDSGGFVSAVATETAYVALRGAVDSTSAPVVIDGPAPARYSYPAYGEQNLPPVTRTRTK